MLNLIPLTRKISYWDTIVSNKNVVDRVALQSLRPDILRRMNAYSAHANPNVLETIPASTFMAPNIDLLKGCYKNSNALSRLKTRIRERQDILVRGECQYCNIGEPNTFDHYLPQRDFPEFSALSINLIPCCSYCNNKKGDDWLLHGNRKIIHFYYDVLPSVDFLNCNIIYRQNVPVADFSVNAAVIPMNMRDIVVNHFNTLLLTNRYKRRSNSDIVDVQGTIIAHVGVLTRAQIQQNLQDEARIMKLRKGRNYWRAIIRLALSNSNRFLTEAGF